MSTQPIIYTNYDFDTLLAQLQQRLALKSAWKDMYRSSTGSMLIELFAAVGTLVLYYVERRAEESYIATAQNYSSIMNLARLLNYISYRNVSSTGTLRFSLSAPATKMVFIPKYTACSTTGNYMFLVSADGVIMPGQSYVDVSGIQGVKEVLTRTSSGSTNQEYNIADTKVENSNPVVLIASGVSLVIAQAFTTLQITVDGELQFAFPGSYYTPNSLGTYEVYGYANSTRPVTLEVTVNSVVWTPVTSFINSTNTSPDYVIRPELDGTITIVFGNNVFGKSPAVGDTIVITYVQSDGLAGNVYQTGLITTMNSTIYDLDGAVQTVTVSNTTNFLGGDDTETMEEIRTNAPAVFATGDRAVTKADFVSILRNYPGVADANAWGENEEPNPDYDHFNQVKLVVLLQEWELPDTAFKEVLSTFLYTKSLMTVRYTYIDPVILYVVPTINLKISQGNQLSYIQSQVETAVTDLFVLGSTTKLGTSKRIGDLYEAVEGVSGVAYSHVILKIQKTLELGYYSTYDYAQTVEALPLLAGAVEIYLNGTKIATDNGSGGFIDESSTPNVTGLVDYNTGFVGVDISPAPGGTDVVVVRYQQNQNGDIVVNKEQICKWSENDYTSISYAS